MATPSLYSLSAEIADDTQPPQSPALRVLDIQASFPNQMANTPATAQLRVLDIQANNGGDQPPVSPILRVLEVTAGYGPPPPDYMPPGDVTFGTIEGTQVNGNPQGRTQITLPFSTVTASQVASGEHLGQASGASQNFNVFYYPISSGVGDVYQVESYTGGGGSTVLAVAAAKGKFKISVGSVTNFSIGDWIELLEGGVGREYHKIEDINGAIFTLEHPILAGDFTTAATVKEVTVTQKTETTDWTANRTTGQISLLAGQFTSGKEVFVRYTQDITDLDHYELYRIPGDLPLGDKAHYDEVTGHGSVVTVDDTISSGSTQAQETLSVAQGGQTFSYYLFSLDGEGNVSRAQAVAVETIPSVITDLTKSTGPNEVTLSWSIPSEINVNGVNVFRCSGSWDPAVAVQVNSAPVTSGSFVDGASNVTNRRSSGTVPYPLSGQTYFYSVEVEDTSTDWDTGTQNQAADPLQSANSIASKADD